MHIELMYIQLRPVTRLAINKSVSAITIRAFETVATTATANGQQGKTNYCKKSRKLRSKRKRAAVVQQQQMQTEMLKTAKPLRVLVTRHNSQVKREL
jgi:hypothetical protein